MKLLRVCDLRKHLDAYSREEISFSRMVELLNDDAYKALIEISTEIKCNRDSLSMQDSYLIDEFLRIISNIDKK